MDAGTPRHADAAPAAREANFSALDADFFASPGGDATKLEFLIFKKKRGTQPTDLMAIPVCHRRPFVGLRPRAAKAAERVRESIDCSARSDAAAPHPRAARMRLESQGPYSLEIDGQLGPVIRSRDAAPERVLALAKDLGWSCLVEPLPTGSSSPRHRPHGGPTFPGLTDQHKKSPSCHPETRPRTALAQN